MAIKAYILIEVATGKTKEVVKDLKELKVVKSANVIMGPYDVIALIDCPSYDELSKTCVAKIQEIKGVRYTMTCPIVEI